MLALSAHSCQILPEPELVYTKEPAVLRVHRATLIHDGEGGGDLIRAHVVA